MSKGDFARHINVSPARVSQYISEGILDEEALEGTGRSARIRVPVAEAQIAARRNVGQALGNGLKTAVVGGDSAGELPLSAPDASPLKKGNTAELIQLERLQQEQRRNRREEVEEAEHLGRLVPVDELQRQVRRAAQDVVQLFIGMAPDIAAAITAKFPDCPDRDLQHIIVQAMNAKRELAAKKLAADAELMPKTQDIVLS